MVNKHETKDVQGQGHPIINLGLIRFFDVYRAS